MNKKVTYNTNNLKRAIIHTRPLTTVQSSKNNVDHKLIIVLDECI